MALIVCLALTAPSEAVGQAKADRKPTENEVRAAEAEKLFRSAFNEEVPPAARMKALEEVAQKYPATVWADDALWVMAQWYKKRQKNDEAMKLLVRLAEEYLDPRRPQGSLERFTKTQEVYLKSRLPVVLEYLKISGMCYVGEDEEGRVLNFNPLPMTVHEDLARMYFRKGDYLNSIRHLELALIFGPVGGKYKESLEHQLAMVKKCQKEYEEAAAKFGIKPQDAVPPKVEETQKEDLRLEDFINLEQLKPLRDEGREEQQPAEEKSDKEQKKSDGK